MEILLALDQQLFFLINGSYHASLLDWTALFLSGVGTAGIIWFILGIALFLREEKRDKWFFAPFLAAGAVSWFLVEVIIKPLAARSRPGLELGAIIVGEQNDTFSFPSGHATIAFAMAVVLANKEPKWRWVFYTLAVAIAWSRVYLGNHFPLDVIVGGLLGWAIGRLSLSIV